MNIKSLMDYCWNGEIPVRTDIIAYKSGIKVAPLSEKNKESHLIIINENNNYKIEYNSLLTKKEIRICIEYAISLIVSGLKINTVLRYGQEILANERCLIDKDMYNAFDILYPEEALNVYVHGLKMYKIEDLSKIFDGYESHLYYQLKKYKYL